MKKGKLKLYLFSLFCLFSIILIFSCEIGLGSAVDTVPPTVEITNPPVDSIVRGSLGVSGSWSDDGTIAGVKVTLNRTDGRGEAVSAEAQVITGLGGKGSWSAVFEPVEDGILDGSYEALIEISDAANHKTTQTRTFAIDNTAPVIVLQRPGTKISETPDAYGQTFTLNGMGADDNSIDHIDINIYSDAECTNLLKTITKTNVPPTIELEVAAFEDGKENDYSTIYGSTTKNGSQVRYCTITAYDNAKRYPLEGERSEEDERGNSTSNYYLYEDIYDSILDHYTITDVYKMLSGTYLLADSSRSVETVTNVKALLNQYKITESNFSLDPENSPQFIVNGRDPLTGTEADYTGTDYNISSGTSVVIEVATGLDGIPLEPATLRPYLLPCEAGGFTAVEDKAENRIYLAEAGSGTKSGTSYKYTVNFDHTTAYPNGKSIAIGSAYIIRVEGHDKNGNSVRPKGGAYGFKLASNGAAPGLQITKPASTITYVGANGSQRFEGTVSCQDGYPVVTIKNGTTGETVWTKTVFSAEEITDLNGVPQYSFVTDIDYSGESENSQIQYTVEASLGDLKTTAFKTIIYDKDKPEVSVGSILPVAQKYDSASENTTPLAGEYLNGIVTVKLTLNDAYDAIETEAEDRKPYFEVIEVGADGSESVKSLWLNKVGLSNTDIVSETNYTEKHYIKKLINAGIDIDTTDIQTEGTEEKGIKFKVYAWDRAGNAEVYTYPEPTATEANPVLKVDQATDKPVILPAGELTFTKYSCNGEAVNTDAARKTHVASGGNLQFYIYDDDKIDSYKIWWTPIADENETKESADSRISATAEADRTYREETNLSSTEITKSVNAESQAGNYWYKIYVKDKNGNESNAGPFVIKVTTAAPTITRITAVESEAADSTVGKYISKKGGQKTKWKNKIEVNSSETTFSLYRAKNPVNPSLLSSYELVKTVNDTKVIYDTIETSSDSTITDDVKYYYYVKDNNDNNSNTDYITCLTDNDVPAVSYKHPLEGEKKGVAAISSTTYKFEGNAADEKTISGIYYKILSVTDTTSSTAAPAGSLTQSILDTATWTAEGWSVVAGGESWEFYRNINSGENAIAEGKYRIYMYAVDGAGTVSDADEAADGKQPYSREFDVDMADPELKNITAGDVNRNTNSDHSRKVVISGNVTETHGIATLTVNDAEVAVNSGSWSYEKTEASDGSYTYTIKAKDAVGKTDEKTITVNVDVTAPEVSTDEAKFTVPDVQQSESSMFKFEGKSGSVTDTGTGIEKVEIAFTDGTATQPSGVQSEAGSGTDGSWASTVEFTGGAFSSQGTKWLWVKAYDKAGNDSGWKAVKSFMYDKAAPEINFTEKAGTTNPDEDSYMKKGFTLEVEAKDTNELDSVKVSWEGLTEPVELSRTGTTDKYTVKFKTGSESGDGTFLADKKYEFKITAKDAAGKEESVTRRITVDTTPPQGSFEEESFSPKGKKSGNGDEEKTWYKSNSIRFAVSVTEANLSSIGIAKENTDSTVFDAMSPVNGLYTGLVSGLEEGANTVYVKMTDHAGNENTIETTVYTDTVVPSVTVSGNLAYMGDQGFTVSVSAADSGAEDNPVTGSGTESLTISEQFREDESQGWGSATTESIVLGASPSKKLPLGTITRDGYFKYTVSLKDKAGNEKTASFETTVDRTAPELEIANPGSGANAKKGTNAIDSNSYQFKGTIDEQNKVSAVYYKVAGKDEAAPEAQTGADVNYLDSAVWAGWEEVSAEAESGGGYNWSFYRDIKSGTDAIAEGQYKIYMYAVDGAGNLSDADADADGKQAYSREFDVDMAAPVVTAAAPEYVKKSETDNGKVTISGSVTETHGIKNFKVTRGSKVYQIVSGGNVQTVPAGAVYSWTWNAAQSGATWSLSEKPGDGEYTYTIEAEDLVGRKNDSLEKKVTVDTVAPLYKEGTLKAGGAVWSESAYYKDTTLKMTGEFTEVTSGMEALYYYVQYPGRSGSAADDLTAEGAHDGEVNFKSGQTDFSFTAENYKDNTQTEANTIYIQAADKAGNKSEVKSFIVNIDTTAPELTALYYQVGTGSLKKAGGTVYANGTKSITVYGNYKDEQSGIEPLILKVGSTTIAASAITYSQTELVSGMTQVTAEYAAYAEGNSQTIRSWKAVFTPGESLNGSLKLSGSNRAGGPKDENSFTVSLDTAKPEITSWTINGAYYDEDRDVWFVKDGAYTISGVCDDKLSGMDSVSLEIEDANGTRHTYKNSGSGTVWTFDKEVKTSPTGTPVEEAISFTEAVLGTVENKNGEGEFELKADASVTIKALDNAGNEESKILHLEFDNGLPYGKHEIDSKEKDLYFRVGIDDNSEEEDINVCGLTKDTALDTKVGGKYKLDTYGKDLTITINGRAEDGDGGSGIRMIYYKVYTDTDKPETETEAARTTLINGIAAAPKGSFMLSGDKEKRVFYNVSEADKTAGKTYEGTQGRAPTAEDSYYKYYKNVKTNYEATLNGFTEGANYLYIVFEDNAGNRSLNSVEIDGEKYYSCSLNVDTQAPRGDSDLGETIYSNGSGSIGLSGTVDDDFAGIDSVTIKVGSTTAGKAVLSTISTEPEGSKKRKWSYTLDAGLLNITEGSTRNISVTAIAKDKARNESPIPAATVTPDTTGPDVSVTLPRNADSTKGGHRINGTIGISGSASDLHGLHADEGSNKTLELYYTKNAALTEEVNGVRKVKTGSFESGDAGSKWKKIGSAKHGAEWSIENIDTTTLGDDEDTVYITAVAEDSAGNKGYSPVSTAVIDQNTDRPKISFSTIKLGDNMSAGTTEEDYSKYVWLKNQTTVKFSVNDDDGEVEWVKVSLDGSDYRDAVLDTESGEYGYDLKNFYTGNASEKEKEANGPKKIYFKVKDSGKTTVSESIVSGKEFESGTEDALGAVYLADGTNLYGGEDHEASILYLKVDTIFPEVVLKGVQVGTNGYSTSYATQKTGGSVKTISAKFSAEDANGMKADGFTGSAEYIYRENDIQNKITVEGTVTPDADGDYVAAFTLSNEQYAALQGYDGEVNIKVSGEDSAGNITPQTASIQHDYKPAEVLIMNPKSGDTISGAIDTYGSVLETATLKYAVTGESGTPAAADYRDVTGVTASWTISFDGGTDTGSQTHTKTLNKYLIDLGIAEHDANSTSEDAIDPETTEFQSLKLWIQSTDGAGNVKAFSFPLTVDPQGDRPTLKLSYPTSDGTTVGGSIDVYGTAMDLKGSGENNANAGVDSVWMQIISTTHEKDSAAASKTWGNVANFTLGAEDLNYMQTYGGYRVFNRKKYNASKTVDTQDPGTEWNGALASGESYDDYAAYVSIADSSWSQTVNANEELNPKSEEGVTSDPNTAAIRIYARDKDKKFSQYKECRISVDSDTPEIKNLVLKQMASIDAASATAEKVYTESMFVKGDWYLTGTVTDKDMISYLKVGNHVLVSGEKVQSGDTVTWTITKEDAKDESSNVIGKATLSTDKKTVDFIYRLGTGSGNAELKVDLIAKDAVTSGQPHVAGEGKPLVINYDNTPPEHLTTASSFGTVENGRTVIAQKSGWYTISAKAREDGNGQSGFAYTAFYFERELNGTKYIYDILKGRDDAKITLPASVPDMGAEDGNAPDGTLVKKDDIYWIRKNVSSVNNEILSLDAADIRKNSLVSVNGSLYTVIGQSAATITLDAIPAGSVSKVYVAVAGLIDDTTTEKVSDNPVKADDGYYTAASFIHDDGDRMSESVVKTQSIWEWEASLNSRNIPDGPVTVHYVAYDKAGNARHGSQGAYISNNRPRLAGVILKTDYNGDGIFTEDTETSKPGEVINSYASSNSYAEYYTGTKGSGASAKYVFDPDEKVYGTNAKNPLGDFTCGESDKPVAVLRGKTEIVPEIVGGNGAIYYEYDVGGTKGKNTEAFISEGSIDYTAVQGTIKVHPGDLAKFGDAASKLFRFIFWDSTQGGTTLQANNPDGTPDTQSVKLDMYMGISTQTVGTPVVRIKPFYWNSVNDNSVYSLKERAKIKNYKDLEGHIELTSDLNFTGTEFGEDDGLMDKDPKVSGKIIIEGTAHDDSLIAKMDAIIFGEGVNLANYSGGKLVSKRNKETGFGTTAATAWYFEVVSQTTGKEGDDVEWKLYIDTEVLGQAALDASITVTASNFGKPHYAADGSEVNSIDGTTKYSDTPGYTDEEGHPTAKTNTPGTTQTASTTDSENNPVLTAYYRMDIVPYIREVKTSLSEVNSGNPTVYSRTALGHYPVYVTFAGGSNYDNRLREDITLEGFNLAGCTLNFENDDPDSLTKKIDGATEAVVEASASVTADANGKYKIPAAAGSGHVYASKTAGGKVVKSLNNLNNDNAQGSGTAAATGKVGETGDEEVFADYYNRQPNGVNNNRLTDDVYIDIWEFNREAAKAFNNTRVDNLEMKINPYNGMLGFAFSNGSTRFAMPKANNSYQQWNRTYDYMGFNALAYDTKGESYAVSVGGDISSGGAADIDSLMTSRWGWVGASQGSNKGTNNHRRMESIGQRVSSGDGFDFRKKNRFQSQSLATREHTHNSVSYTDVFLAYYDLGNDEIRLKVGTINGGSNNYGQFVDRGDGKNGTNHRYSQDLDYLLVLARTADPDNTLGTAGPYVSVGVTQKTAKPIVVVTWYDGSDLKFAWAEYSYNNNNLLTTAKGLCGNQTTVTWNTSTIMTGAGEYCQLVVDSDDGIHIAAYDGDNLKYAYLNSYNDTKPAVVTVDSYLDVGSNLTIDVAKVGNNQIPYIGYAASEPEQPRYAYIANIPKTIDDDGKEIDKTQSAWTSEDIAGVDSSDKYTGVWECTVVPTVAVEGNTVLGTKMLTSREISVGVWKYNGTETDNGKLAYSTTGNNRGKTNGANSYSSSYANATVDSDTTSGICYGNGSRNGVLAYVVAPSAQTTCVETAQMR